MSLIVVPLLSHPDPVFAEAGEALGAPALERFLAQAERIGGDTEAAADDGPPPLAAPHERALRRIWGQAARDRSLPEPGTPAGAARLRLMHWQLGRDGAVGAQPEVTIDEGERRALDADLAALLADPQRGTHLQPSERPGEWLLHDAELAALDSAAPLYACLWGIERMRPRGAAARRWQRLSAEIEMLLYTHPVNEARSARGQAPLNAVWLWGGNDGHEPTPDWRAALHWHDDHALQIVQADWTAFADALAQMDTQIAPLLAQPGTRCLLAGARGAVEWRARPRTWWQRWRAPATEPIGRVLSRL